MWTSLTLSSLLLALTAAQSVFPPCRPCIKSQCKKILDCPGGIVVKDKRCPCCYECAKQEHEYCDPPELQDGSRSSWHYCDDGLACKQGSGGPVCQGTAERSCTRGATFNIGCLSCSCSEGRVRCDANPEATECPTTPSCSDGAEPRPTAESCCPVCVVACPIPGGRCEDQPPLIVTNPPAKMTAVVDQPFSYSFTVAGQNLAYEIVEPTNGATYVVNKIEPVDGDRALEAFKVTVTGFAEGVYNICVSNDVGTVCVLTMVQYIKRPSASECCGFEVGEGLCHWKSSSKFNLAWKRGRGPTDTPGTGPQTGYDGSEYYVYAERPFGASPGETVLLCSPKIKPQQNYTRMSFAYHMHGKDVGDLRVKETVNYGKCAPIRKKFLWKRSGNQSSEWQMAEVSLTTEPSWYKFSTICFLVRIGGSGTEGDIAIDHIKFS